MEINFQKWVAKIPILFAKDNPNLAQGHFLDP